MSPPRVSKDLGIRLRYHREQAGLGLRELARRASVDHTMLSRIERGMAPISRQVIDAYEASLDIRFVLYRHELQSGTTDFYGVECPTVLERFTIEIELGWKPGGVKLNGINLIWAGRTGSDSFTPRIHMPIDVRENYSFSPWFPKGNRKGAEWMGDEWGMPLYFTGGNPESYGLISQPDVQPYEEFEIGWRGHLRQDSDTFIFAFDWGTIAPSVEFKLWEVTIPGDAIVSWQDRDLPPNTTAYSRRSLGSMNRDEWYTLKWRTRSVEERQRVTRLDRDVFNRIYEFESKGWVRVAEDIWRNEKGVERKLNDILRGPARPG
nr:helix-turn-helix transcriptional regulator [Geodermatophilus sp. DSM 45219]